MAKYIKIFQIIVLFIMLEMGCTSRIAMLQTDKPDRKQYLFIFGKMLLNYKKTKSLTAEERTTNYERQLNNILKNDQNTSSCSIIPKTINFGEPGSQGTAHVRCQKAVNVQVQKGIFTRDGSPYYSYTLIHR